MAIDASTGLLSWSPSGADLGINAVTATVMDADGLMDSETFSIEVIQQIIVADVNTPPQLTVPQDQTIVFGNLLDLLATATDADVGDTLTFALVNSPTGMVIDAVTGAITWTPLEAQIGLHDVAVKVTDSAGAAAFGSFIVTVQDVNKAPQAVDDIYQTRAGETLTINAPGVLLNDIDSDEDILATSLVDAPARGTAVLQSDGSFTYLYEPPTPDPVNIELEAHCSSGLDFFGSTGPYGQVAVGDVDNDGRVEVVGMAFARIFVMDGATCELEYLMSTDEVNNLGLFPDITAHVGLVDLDGDKDLEIVVATGYTTTPPFAFGQDVHGHLIAYHHDGTLVWNRAVEPGEDARFGNITPLIRNPAHATAPIVDWRSSGPSFADLDQDGKQEILMGFYHDDQTTASSSIVISGVVAFNGEDGSLQWVYFGEQTSNPKSMLAHIADLDLDGIPEVIFQSYVLDINGNRKFSFQLDDLALGTIPKSVVSAIANFDNDAYPEVLIRHSKDFYLFEHDGTRKWKQPFSVADFFENDELTVGDFDGDGKMEFTHRMTEGSNLYFVGFARYQVVYKNDGTVLWSHKINPEYYSNQFERPQAVTAYDVNKDGADDIVADLRIDALTDDPALGLGDAVLMAFNGKDGTELFRARSYQDSSTSVFPVIADLDNDGEAEILLSGQPPLNTLATETRFHIYQGKSTSPLPPAPPIHSQWSFNPAYVNLDGSIPANPVPHWLIPGLNGFHKVPTVANVYDRSTITDSFTYKANDGSLDSNLATVTLEILPAGNPPVFLSQADTLTTVGFQYEYDPFVVDADPGDIVSFSLTAAPAGMTIDPSSGKVRWLSDTTGAYSVAILASDTIGFATLQSYILLVGEPVEVPDVVGQPEATAESTLTGANLLVGKKQQANHPTIPAGAVSSQTPIAGSVIEFGGAVDLILSLGPAPEDIDDDNDTFTENEGDCDDDDDTIYPGAADPAGDGIDQDCDGIDGNLELVEILVLPVDSTVLTSQSVSLKAVGIFVDGTSQNLTNIVTWSAGPEFSSSVAGTFPVTATRDLIVGTTTVNVSPRVVGDVIPPQVEITAPESNNKITEPVDVAGTASDVNFLKYELAYALAGETNFTTLKIGTTAVSNGILGQFDPTMLLNDIYTIRLTVFDKGGNQTVAETTVQVDENMKVGNFSLTFTDLQIPMSGIPITVNRTYDSRDKSKGDFGIGWRLDVQTLSCRTNRILGTGWRVDKPGLSFQLVPTDIHQVSLTLSDGRVEEFDMVVSPKVSPLTPFPAFANRASFSARPGTLGKLESLDNNNLTVLGSQPGEVFLVDDITIQDYNPQRFKYTSADGTEIIISKMSGVEKITEPNGNTLEFRADGIFHSAGKQALFVRDSEGRIIRLVDPNGNDQIYGYDGNGDLSSHADQVGNVTVFRYNHNHGLLKVIDPLGNSAIRNEYDNSGRLIATIDAQGNRIEYTNNVNARQQIIKDTRGNSEVLNYDKNGNVLNRESVVTIEEIPRVARTSYTYDVEGNETSIIDPDGVTSTFMYDENNNLISSTIDPDGMNLTQTSVYDEQDRLLSRTYQAGSTTLFSYDSRGNLTSITDALGHTTSFIFDSAGRQTSKIDPLGNQVSFKYNSFGQKTQEEYRNAAGNTTKLTEFEYNPNGKKTSKTEYSNFTETLESRKTTFVYDNSNHLVQTIDALGNSTTNEFNALGNQIATLDSFGNRTEFIYNSRGELIRTIFADATTIQNNFDTNGNLIKSTDQLGRETSFQYDELNRLTKTIAPDLTQTQTIYSLGGKTVANIDENGNRVESVYDAVGRKIQTILPEVEYGVSGTLLTPTLTNAYNQKGELVSVTDANGNITSFEYDDLGRQIKTTFADSSFTQKAYDAISRVQSTTDERGLVTLNEYDDHGRLIKVIQPLPTLAALVQPITRYTYDGYGNYSSQIDALGRTTTFVYNKLDYQINRIMPEGQIEAIDLDLGLRPSQMVDSNGHHVILRYDSLNRVIEREYEDSEKELITYTKVGKVETLSNSQGTIFYVYDVNDRLKSVTQANGKLLEYSYTPTGLVSQLIIDSVVHSQYTYDALNRLKSVSSEEGVTRYGYDPSGNQIVLISANGSRTISEFNERNYITQMQLFSSDDVLIEQYDYTYNASGMRKSVIELDGSVESYEYDQLNQLVSTNRTGTNPYVETFKYDLVGNRLEISGSSGTTTYEFDSNDRLISSTNGSFAYDANGSRISKTQDGLVTSYSWNLQNKLESVSDSSGTTEFNYDPNGDRIRKSSAVKSINYVINTNDLSGLPQVVQEYSDSDASLKSYSYGTDLLAEKGEINNEFSFYHYDAHGNTRRLTNEESTTSAVFSYASYGKENFPLSQDDPSYLYSGEQVDRETGLQYLRARHYDMQTGVFLSQDPISGNINIPASLHKYQYANNDPINNIDPTGLYTLAEINISSFIQAGLRLGKNGATARKAYCTAATTIGTVEGAAAVLHIGSTVINLLTNKFDLQASVIVPLPKKRELTVNLNPDVFGDNRLKGFEGAFSIEFVLKDGPSLTIAKNKDGLFASGKGFVGLIPLTACGLQVAELGIEVEAKTGAGATSAKPSSITLSAKLEIGDPSDNNDHPDWNYFDSGGLSFKFLEIRR